MVELDIRSAVVGPDIRLGSRPVVVDVVAEAVVAGSRRSHLAVSTMEALEVCCRRGPGREAVPSLRK